MPAATTVPTIGATMTAPKRAEPPASCSIPANATGTETIAVKPAASSTPVGCPGLSTRQLDPAKPPVPSPAVTAPRAITFARLMFTSGAPLFR